MSLLETVNSDVRVSAPSSLGPGVEHALPPRSELLLAQLDPALRGCPLRIHIFGQGFHLRSLDNIC